MNDNTPIFQSAPYTFIFKEEQADNTEVGRHAATDKDIGTNADIIYELVSGHIVNGQGR